MRFLCSSPSNLAIAAVISLIERYEGSLLGLACGDALGTTVEFSTRGSFDPLTTIVGGGPFGLKAGEWTDDTSMALCLAASLIYCKEFNAVDQMNRYCNWRNVGYMSSNGDCFDIGTTISKALAKYLQTGNPFSGDIDHKSAGNGALMRLAPIAMMYAMRKQEVFKYAGESTRTTHGAQEAIECSRLFGLQLRRALLGYSKDEILSTSCLEPLSHKVAAISNGDYRNKPIDDIKGSGYCVESLEAALWCFSNSSNYEEAVLMAANLGDDADTTAAICGQISGAFYGSQSIPLAWRNLLVMHDDMVLMAHQLLDLAKLGASK
jgi:ADP-ribosyl-[dinitrogen reductase] hydrolase